MKIIRSLTMVALFGLACFNAPLHAQSPAQAPALGLVVKSVGGYIGNAGATEGSSIYSGDYVSTGDNGSLLIRMGALSLELEGSSGAHIYRAPYGAVVELNHGSAIYSTPGGQQNLVIVASDVRVTPDVSAPGVGRVSIDDPCKLTVQTQRGQADVRVGSESRVIEEGKAYQVRALNELSYRDYLSPDDEDYHKHHVHRPCAAVDMVKGRPPVAAGSSRFVYVAAAAVGTGVIITTLKVFESPDRP